jgi:hypothetical protein
MTGFLRTVKPPGGLALLLLWMLSGSPSLRSAGAPVLMTPATIEEAIAFGQQTTPMPYPLHQEGRWRDGTVQESSYVFGKLYTPFIRVALASHRAWADGRLLHPSEVGDTLVAPVVYVSVRRAQMPDDFDALDGAEIFLVAVGRLAPFAIPPAQRVRPQWVRTDGAVLQAFEDQDEIRAVAFVAAFPIDALRPDWYLVYERQERGGRSRLFNQTLISQNDLTAWR